MKFSYEEMEMLLNGNRDFDDIEIQTEKMLVSIIDKLFLVYEKYLLWSYEEFESAVDFLENTYEAQQLYLNTTHEGIFKRMKEHTSKRGMSFGEKLVKRALEELGFSFKQECYIGHSEKERHTSSIRLDFVVFHNNVLYVIEYNGKQHYEPSEKFGGIEQFKIQQENDRLKRSFCSTYKIPLIEIPYTVNTVEEVKSMIKNIVKD